MQSTRHTAVVPLSRVRQALRVSHSAGLGWKTIVQEYGNYFRRRVHRFEAATTDRLRVNVLETNGSMQTRIYEVRVYNDEMDI
jgi:hypothetical protein